MGRELVDITVLLKHETDRAYLVHDGKSQHWLPKSQVEARQISHKNIYEFTMPVWLATEKGFI